MSDLDPMLEELLRSARQEIGPTEAETHQLRVRLQRKVALGGAVVVGSVLATKGAKASGIIALVSAKLAAISTATTLVFGVATVGLASAFVASRVSEVTGVSVAPVAATSASQVERGVGRVGKQRGGILLAQARVLPTPSAVVSSVPSPVAQPPSISEVLPLEAPPPAAANGTPATRTAPAPKAASNGPSNKAVAAESATGSAGLVAELALLVSANDALNDGNPEAALRLLDQRPLVTSAASQNAELAQERSGLRVVASCAAGHADGPAAARRFLRMYPRSPLGARVRATCSLEGDEREPPRPAN